jgi:transcriptional regulator with XRE-family HTH domain
VVVRLSGEELMYQLAIRGWDQQSLVRESGVSAATISRAVAGKRIRAASAMRMAQALRRADPVPELLIIVPVATRGS